MRSESYNIRAARGTDHDVIWSILEPMLREARTYPLPHDWDRAAALDYWFSDEKSVFVVEDCGEVLGTYYLRANNLGGGAHVANCGYVTATTARGRGLARAMCAHSFATARDAGFCAMQFNFVIVSNIRAVALWTSMGFVEVGRLPGVFRSLEGEIFDALVLFKRLDRI